MVGGRQPPHRATGEAGLRPLLTKYLARVALIAGALIMAPAFACAQGEHARRAATEIIVMLGDARRMAETPSTSPRWEGLRERILGGLTGLELLLRLADQELGREPTEHSRQVSALRDAFAQPDLSSFTERLAAIAGVYPLRASALVLAAASPERIGRGRRIHESLCAGCHDEPDTTVRRPAYNLFAEARQLEPTELAARLIVGVRGDASTGIDTPLSDEEIASLLAYYASGRDAD